MNGVCFRFPVYSATTELITNYNTKHNTLPECRCVSCYKPFIKFQQCDPHDIGIGIGWQCFAVSFSNLLYWKISKCQLQVRTDKTNCGSPVVACLLCCNYNCNTNLNGRSSSYNDCVSQREISNVGVCKFGCKLSDTRCSASDLRPTSCKPQHR